MSGITFIDGEKGILRYSGYAIEELAEKFRLYRGRLHPYLWGTAEPGTTAFNSQPHSRQRSHSRNHVPQFRGFSDLLPPDGDSLCDAQFTRVLLPLTWLRTIETQDLEHLDVAATILISKVRSLAAMTYRMKLGRPFIYPKGQLSYCSNFLHMMFSEPYADYTASSRVDRALNLVLLLHADHEQNCSTSTVRMVASGGANLFASVSAGVCALWGPAHGGANMAVIQMLEAIHKEGDDGTRFVEAAKSGDRSKRLMGFGHRVYKNFDPRAKILKEASKKALRLDAHKGSRA